LNHSWFRCDLKNNGQEKALKMQSSNPQTNNDYSSDHLIAKLTVYLFYVLIGVASIEAGTPYLALIFGTALWLFGVNGVAYCVESLRGHTHQHKPL
jgi:hypothetical protein